MGNILSRLSTSIRKFFSSSKGKGKEADTADKKAKIPSSASREPNMSPDEHKKQKVYKKDGVWTVDGHPREVVKFLSEEKPSNLPGKSVITVLITFPPNGASPPHTHSGAAVTALVHTGKVLDQMNDGEPFISKPGETFSESPGCHHNRGENAGGPGEEASFFAVMVIDTKTIEESGYEALLVVDAEVEEKKREKAEGK